MNILRRLPDDLQEMIYKHLHQSNMKSIQNELEYRQEMIYKKLHQSKMKSIKNDLEDELNKRWLNNDDDDYIPYFYPTDYAMYRLYDYNLKLHRPEKVAFNGYCKFYINTYSSSILVNPTYVDILLEVDKVINQIFENDDDYDNISLEEVYEDGKTEYDETYGDVKIIYVNLY